VSSDAYDKLCYDPQREREEGLALLRRLYQLAAGKCWGYNERDEQCEIMARLIEKLYKLGT
jgi:hypothetical protein